MRKIKYNEGANIDILDLDIDINNLIMSTLSADEINKGDGHIKADSISLKKGLVIEVRRTNR